MQTTSEEGIWLLLHANMCSQAMLVLNTQRLKEDCGGESHAQIAAMPSALLGARPGGLDSECLEL